MSYSPEFLARVAERRAALEAEVAALLPAPRPIVWEIGSGHGHFLVRYASEHPDRYCIGVDIILDRLNRSDRKRNRAQLGNCHFVRAEAREFFHALPPGVTLQEVWVLFPDPWPKARHHKHRILKPAFFAALAGRAEAGARFYFRTDHTEYFQEVAGFFRDGLIPTWRLDPAAPWPVEQETVFQARAPSYHSLVAVRTEDPAPVVATPAPGQPIPVTPKSPA